MTLQTEIETLKRHHTGNGAFATNEAPKSAALDKAHEVFRKWLGDEYDIDSLDAMLATLATEKLTGDPLWLMLIGGPGATKTETVSAASGMGAIVISTIASEGALLSGTAAKERDKTATGGLLRKIGERGVLVIKDLTSIISADRNVRSQVLAAIREIYDGRWTRNIGSNGGKTLTWTGHLTILAAVTTAWDSAHSVVASMGDRFLYLRIDSTSQKTRKASGMKSIRNTGQEIVMRRELAEAMAGVVAVVNTDVTLNDDERAELLDYANITTMARTAIEHDYKGDVINAHAPEMPTRFAKQLVQMVRGAIAIGMTRDRAMQLAIRCARDSIPPLRTEVLLDIAANKESRVADIRKRINKPWSTINREVQGLQMLQMLVCDEEEVEEENEFGKKKKSKMFRYSLAADFDQKTLMKMTGTTDDIKDLF